jgi:hypothetical protein
VDTEREVTGDTDWPMFAASARIESERMSWQLGPDHVLKNNGDVPIASSY